MTKKDLISWIYAEYNIDIWEDEILFQKQFCPDTAAEMIPLIRECIEKLKQKRRIVQSWIDAIEDPEIRKIIHYRFEKKMNWSQVNTAVYGYPSADYARIRLCRFLKTDCGNLAE